LRQLKALLSKARERSRLCLVAGVSGIGKTALIRELTRTVLADGREVTSYLFVDQSELARAKVVASGDWRRR